MSPRQARTVNINKVAPDAAIATAAPATAVAPAAEVAPAVVVLVPEGTAIPPIAAAPISTTLALVTTPAAGADLPNNSAPVTVPVAPTAAQLAAREMRVNVNLSWIAFMGAIPGAAGSTFAEPDDDAIDALIEAYMTENAGTRLTKAAFAVKDQIDAARAAHQAAMANSNGVKLDYYHAARHELLGVLDAVDQLIVNAGGKVKKSASASTASASVSAAEKKTVTGDKKATATWAERAKKLHAWGKAHGLPRIIFVDQTVGGYEGQYHAVELHADGRLEKCAFNPDTYEATGTGEFVTSPIYFTAPDGSRPKYSPDQMFGILLGKLKLEGVNMKGVKSHLGNYKEILENASRK